MDIKILGECGYHEAIEGLRLSYQTSTERAIEASRKLYNKDGGHNKFLEMMHIWVSVRAPRYWWQESDTYRISTKQSESTMHTLSKRELTQDNFEYPINEYYLAYLNVVRNHVLNKETTLERFKNELPEGFLQRRIWNISYKTLRNIIQQRKSHRLLGWHQFCDYMINNVKYNEYLLDFIKENENERKR